MPKFLIEVPHEENMEACVYAVRMLHATGSHFFTHADWGCFDGEHKAWILVELDSKEEARAILPPDYRHSAKIIQLNKFTLEEIDNILKHHQHPEMKSETKRIDV